MYYINGSKGKKKKKKGFGLLHNQRNKKLQDFGLNYIL